MRIRLPYGTTVQEVDVPASNLLGAILPLEVGNDVPDEATLLRDALAHPIGGPRLRDLARPGQRVAIVTSDLTRPCPSDRLLPPLLEELAAAGVRDEEITVVAALGLHRPMTEAELERMAGEEVYRRVRVINHDPQDTLRVGVTAAGTPVEIFRPVVEAELRICLGNLELHYFAGYSGGAKAILPGCASRATVRANHAWMVQPEAAAGRLAGNPVRTDLEEGAAMVGVDFILNVVVDGEHHIVAAVAGDVTHAHRRGCKEVDRRGQVAIPALADVVVVSAGGYPKDVNLYQAQKALDNAGYAVRRGGIILLVAECAEGMGSRTFEAWMREACSPDDLVCRIRREFVLGGHKAAAVGAIMQRADIYLVSALPPALVEACGMRPFAEAGVALEAAMNGRGEGVRVLAFPEGGSVLPVVR
jgi:nickel-dependent lactate racemase